MRQRLLPALCACLTAALGQTSMKPEKTERPPGVTLGAGERVMLYASRSAGSVTVVHGSRVGHLRIIVSGAGAPSRALSAEGALPEPIVLFGPHVVFLRQGMGGHETWALDTETGKEARLNVSLMPALAASSEDRLVLAGAGSLGRIVLSSLNRELSETASGPLPVANLAQLLRCELSFDSNGRALLIDRVDPAYLPISVTGKVEVGERVALSGSEIDLSRKIAKPVGRFREQLLLAHVRARNGNDLFFLGPYKETEGYRLAEFGPDGRQHNAYRLQAAEGGVPAGWSNRTLSVTPESLDLMSIDGTRRVYRRP